MTMWCEITEVTVFEYLPATRNLEINGTMEIYLYVCQGVCNETGGGEDQLALQFSLLNAHVIGTIHEGLLKQKPSMMLMIQEIFTGDLVSSHSSFGPVNDLLI